MPQKIAKKFMELVSPYDHVIWDWNGTLLNDIDIVIETISHLLDKHNLESINVDKYKEHFGFPIYDFYKKLGFELNMKEFQDISDEFHKVYEDKLADANLFDGVMETLELIGESKTQSILSAAGQTHLDKVVNDFGLHMHFTHIFGQNDNLATSKVDRGKQLIDLASIPLEKTILIGDTDHDHEVAEALDIDVLLVADGHQEAGRLKNVHHLVLETRF